MPKTNLVPALCIGLCLIAATSCGNDAPEPANKLPPPSTGSSASSSMQAAAPMPAPVLFAAKTSPRAACVLHQQRPVGPGKGLNLVADHRGIVRFYSNALATDLAATAMVLDCKGEDGAASVSSQIIDPDSAIAFAKDLHAARLTNARLQTALSGDQIALSQAQLIAQGHPLRPDPKKAPAQYARWLQIVSAPKYRVQSKLVVRPGLNLPDSTDNWSGGLVNAPAGAQFDSVEGQWKVPAVTSPRLGYATDRTPTEFRSVLWVGLDGTNGSNSLVQTGTEQDVSDWYSPCGNECLHDFKYTMSVWNYYAWVEWFPAFQASVPLSIEPGDQIWAQAWVGDASGNPTPAGAYAWFYLYNSTTGEYYNSYPDNPVGKPADANFQGNTAEWVMERPGQCEWFFGWSCFKYSLADYGYAQIDSPVATASDDNPYYWGFNPSLDEVFDMSVGSTVFSTASAVPYGRYISVGNVWEDYYVWEPYY